MAAGVRRILGGSLRGRKLLDLPGGTQGVRPTSVRARRAIFDRLQHEIVGARVLDVFAGTGALAIEAVSRGAAHAVLLERDDALARFLVEQTRVLGLTGNIEVFHGDCVALLDTARLPSFELVFVDPPYREKALVSAVARVLARKHVADGGVVVWEHARAQDYPVQWPEAFELEGSLRHGDTVLEFFRYRSGRYDMSEVPALSARASAVRPSATFAVAARAAQLRSQGHNVLDLSAGEPDFRPPEPVTQALRGFIENEPVHYSPVAGLPALRDSVAVSFSRYHGREFNPTNVLVSSGVKHSLMNLFLAALSPGDEVVIPAPYWVSYPDMVQLADGEARIVPTLRQDGWRLMPDVLERAIGARTRLVLLNSPGNPTGTGYRAEHVKQLGEVLARAPSKPWLVVDDIYRKLVYDGFEHASAFRALRDVTDRIIVADGVSKSYAMTGYRIGFLVGPTPLIEAAARIQGHMTSGAATPSQRAALAALEDPECQRAAETMRLAFERRRNALLAGIAKIPGMLVHPPEGAFYVFCDVTAHIGPNTQFADDVALATWLLADKLVATVPGTEFGCPGHIRISYAASDDTLQEAVVRIHTAIAAL